MNRRGISIQKNIHRGGEGANERTSASLNELQSTLNQGTEVVGIIGNQIPKQKNGDTTVRLGPPYFLALAYADGTGARREVMIPMDLYTAGQTPIADVATGGGATAAANADAINSILALLRAMHLLAT